MTRKPQPVVGGGVQPVFAVALQHHQAGRLAEAERLYRQVLAVEARHEDALHLLGVVALQTRRHALAADLIGRAIGIKPSVAAYHCNLGAVCSEQGRLDEAVGCYRRALALQPDYPEAHNNLGTTLREQGRLAESVACYRRALALKPGYAEAHFNLGLTLAKQGALEEAAGCYGKALELRPQFAEAHDALGNLRREQERWADAVGCYRRALAVRPDLAQVHNNLGSTLKEQGALDEAIACCRQAIALQRDFPEAYTNLGSALAEQGALDEALGCYRKALALRPDFPEAWNNLATLLREQGDLEAAIDGYRRAVALRPDYADAHFGLGMALLAQGELEAGWREYEWRWQTSQMRKGRRAFPQPQWHGETAVGQTLLLHAEQGFGDTLQFCRYAALARQRGLRVVLEVEGPLVRLMRGLAGVDVVVARGEALPAFDWHCPLLSMPLAVGTGLGSIPGAEAYLRADAGQVAALGRRLAAMGRAGPRVGLVWAGSARLHAPALAAVDRRRSLPPERLAPLVAVPGLHFVSLQKSGPAAPDGFGLTDVMAEMEDFADTAALVANLDLVISVDTAVAHLAAALGKPVWLLERFDSCWRWLNGRRDSPWYPSMLLYRQDRPGAWETVLAEVAGDLRRRAAGG